MTIKQSGIEYEHSIVEDVLLIIFQMVLLYVVLETFENKSRRKWYDYPEYITEDDNMFGMDVIQEKENVEAHMKRKTEN